MNRNKIAMALCIALVVSGICTAVLARQVGKNKSSAPSSVSYVALTRSIEAGNIVHPGDMKMISWPANVPLVGGFTRTQDVLGRTALTSLAADSPVLNQNLAAPGAGVGLSVRIPDGMRAISLKSDEVVGVSGFLFPGSHVDALVTYRSEGSAGPVTATVLQNAEVLAAGTKIAPDPAGVPANVNEVTLLLTPEDAAKAVLASSQGTIHFVLRNGSDSVQQHSAPVQMSQLDGTERILPTVPVTKVFRVPIHTAKATMTRPAGIETVMGDKAGTANF